MTDGTKNVQHVIDKFEDNEWFTISIISVRPTKEKNKFN